MTERIDEIIDSGNWPEDPQRSKPISSMSQRLKWGQGQGHAAPAPAPKPVNPRFAVPAPAGEPGMEYLGQGHIDALMARIRAEEEQPPHKKNAARIVALKQQAMELMRRVESQWVQCAADKLLPRLED